MQTRAFHFLSFAFGATFIAALTQVMALTGGFRSGWVPLLVFTVVTLVACLLIHEESKRMGGR